MRKIQLVVLLLWVFHFASFATNQDSLLQVYQNSPYDTARIDAAHELFKQTIRSDREKAVNYNQFIVATSERLNYGRGQMYGAYSQGVLAYLKGDFPTALQYYDQAAILAEATGNEPAQFVVDKASIYLVTGKLDTASQLLEAALEQLEMTNDYYNSLRATNNLGVIYSNQGNYEKALGVYQKAKKYAETIGDSSFIASFSVNIGNSYFNLGKNAEAIKNLLDAVEISENLKDDRAQAVALNTIGEQYLESNQPEKAITYLEKSRAIKQRLGLIPSFGRTLIFEGQAYFALDDKEMALKRINEAINLLEKANEVKGLASAYFTKSNILFASKQWEQGVVFLQKAEVTANEGQQTDILSDVYLKYAEIINLQASAAFLGENLNVAAALDKAETNALTTDNKKSLADIYRAQAKFYGQNGRYEKAFRYSEKLQSITDSLYTTEQLRALEDMRTKYETTQKEQENELLLAKNELVNRQNQLYLGGLLAVLLAAFLLGFLYLKLRRTTEELALQKQKVEAQNIELQDLNQTKDRFFSIIAHDLRSPIAAFQGIGSQINYFVRKKAFDRLSELGNAINESSTQLNNLLDNLLNWAMSQTGKIPYRPKKLRAVEQIEEVAALLEGVSQAKNIQLSIDGDENHIVYADERAVNTVLRNLLTNAIKFSNNGDTIWLSTNKKDDYVVISVKDEGVGMTAEQVNQLFQVEKNSQKGTKGELGTGLGLVLVQELVQINDGKVEVRSELGKGTTFKVYLPQEAG